MFSLRNDPERCGSAKALNGSFCKVLGNLEICISITALFKRDFPRRNDRREYVSLLLARGGRVLVKGGTHRFIGHRDSMLFQYLPRIQVSFISFLFVEGEIRESCNGQVAGVCQHGIPRALSHSLSAILEQFWDLPSADCMMKGRNPETKFFGMEQHVFKVLALVAVDIHADFAS